MATRAEITPNSISREDVRAAVAFGFIRVRSTYGLNDDDIGDKLDVHRDTIRAWRNCENDISGLNMIRAARLWPEAFADVLKMVAR